ncbi:MAG: hypothetical protein CMF69_00615 [Magnetovibrio sp.]|nr:hypothetical protein [Magnetovibrio sp.]
MLLISLAGCSQFKFFYFNADYLIESTVEDYLSLSEEDRSELRSNIGLLLNWHQNEMLLHYAEFLDKQIPNFEKSSLNKKQIIEAVSDARVLFLATLEGAAPFIANVLERHTSKEKIAHLAARLKEKEQEDLQSASSNTIDETEKRAKIKSNFERFMGNLNKTQLNAIDSYIEATEEYRFYLYNRRVERREKLLILLQQNPSKDDIEIFLVGLFSDNPRDTVSEKWWAHFTNLLIEVSKSIEQNQLDELSRSFSAYSADMKALIRKK